MNENILVIEHRDDLLNKIIDILKERHYNPISTKSRSQANTIANESDIGLIILDVDIADSQGLQLLETFKEQEKTKGIPVILISTPYKKIEFIEEAISLGLDYIIFTPFDEMEFIVAVNSAINLRKLYLEHQKLLKNYNQLEEALNDSRETADKNYKSYQDAQKKYDDILPVDLDTGLLNKKEFDSQFLKLLYESVRHEEVIIVASFTIDGMENLINEFGIIAADEIFIQFTEILRDTTRKEDIIARIDKNLFLVVFKRMNLISYEEKVNEIKNLVAKNEIDYNNFIIKYTISVGISYTSYKSNYHVESVDKEIAPCLLALHNAKRRGYSSVFIHPTIIRK